MTAISPPSINRRSRFLWLIVIMAGLFYLFPATSGAAEKNVLIVSSRPLKPYETVALAFIEELSKTMAASSSFTVRCFNYRRITLTGSKSSIPADGGPGPDLILAIGTKGFKAAVREGAPTIYTLVPRPDRISTDRTRVTGISMRISPAAQLDAILKVFPETKKIGVIYSRKNSIDQVTLGRKYLETHVNRPPETSASAEAKNLQPAVKLVALEAENARQLPGLLDSLTGVDCVWMLADPLLVTPETVEKTMLFSLEQRIPVLTFAPKYLKTGAAVAVGFDLAGIGRQAAAMAAAILNGTPVADIRPAMPESRTTVNRRVVDQLKKWRADAREQERNR